MGEKAKIIKTNTNVGIGELAQIIPNNFSKSAKLCEDTRPQRLETLCQILYFKCYMLFVRFT